MVSLTLALTNTLWGALAFFPVVASIIGGPIDDLATRVTLFLMGSIILYNLLRSQKEVPKIEDLVKAAEEIAEKDQSN